MKLFLIRHGETVDNVAQVYAGVKDSALTVHGSLQADRLGYFYVQNGLRFTNVFSSDLQRAYRTAEAILAAQRSKYGEGEVESIQVIRLQGLREQDFGFYEGKPFYARSRDSSKSGKDSHRSQHLDDPDFQDVESKASMDARMDDFVTDHLLPLISDEGAKNEETVAIVSHGIILSHLWRCILKLFGKGTVTLAPGLSVRSGGVTPLDRLGGWSNTGYLELDIQGSPTSDTTSTDHFSIAAIEIESPNTRSVVSNISAVKTTTKSVHGKEHLLGLKRTRGVGRPIQDSSLLDAASNDQPPATCATEAESQIARSERRRAPHMKMIIKTVNGKEHLKGLKRTRGVGSSKFDEGQKKIETFFKKAKVG